MSSSATTNPLRTSQSVANNVRRSCPACECSDTHSFFRIDKIPAFCHGLSDTKQQATSVRRADLELCLCSKCDLIFNALFDEKVICYSDAHSYDNAQHFSPRFKQFLDATATRLSKRFALWNKTILEIGCGDAYFLDLLARLGNNRGIGVEPTWDDLKAVGISSQVVVHSDWSHVPSEQRFADFVVSRHVLEHIVEPKPFLGRIYESLRRDEGSLYLEVPNSSFLLEQFSPWDVLYEHCLYFTAGSLANLLSRCGFNVLESRIDFNGQMLAVEAKVSEAAQAMMCLEREHVKRERIESFQSRFSSLCSQWNARLEEWQRQGKRVALWGAGTKGAMFLNTLTSSNAIDYAFDINPRKHNKFIAGSGQRIVSPNSLPHTRPDVVLVLNSAYETEIRDLTEVACPKCEVICVNEDGATGQVAA